MQKHPVEQKFNGVLFDPEKVEGAVEDAKRREAQEREQKKVKRKFSRGGKVTGSRRAFHGVPSYTCQQALLLL